MYYSTLLTLPKAYSEENNINKSIYCTVKISRLFPFYSNIKPWITNKNNVSGDSKIFLSRYKEHNRTWFILLQSHYYIYCLSWELMPLKKRNTQSKAKSWIKQSRPSEAQILIFLRLSFLTWVISCNKDKRTLKIFKYHQVLLSHK